MDSNKIVTSLSNFYKDYPGAPKFIDDFYKVLAEGTDLVCQYLNAVKRNSVISTVETYRRVPYFSVDVASISYIMENLLANPNTGSYLGTDSQLLKSLNARVHQWRNGSTVTDKVNVLTWLGMYREFDLSLFTPSADLSSVVSGTIVSLRVENLDGDSLYENKDYVIVNNRLYLLKDQDQTKITKNTVILKDIVIDFSASYEKLGSFLGIQYNPIISKPEYNQINQVFLKTSMFGPTVKNIRNAISMAFGWTDALIYDMHSSLTASQEANWQNETYTPFDFVINMPLEYALDDEKIQMIRKYVSLLKPSYTNYYIQFTDQTIDKQTVLESKIENIIMTPGIVIPDGRADTVSVNDSITMSLTGHYTKTETMSYKAVTGLDSHPMVIADGNYGLDIGVVGSAGMVAGDFTDICTGTLKTFPAMPFVTGIVKNGSGARVTFKDNCTGIYSYQVLRNGVMVKEIKPATFGTFSILTQDDIPGSSGIYRYTMRSAYRPFITQPSTLYYSEETPPVTITI